MKSRFYWWSSWLSVLSLVAFLLIGGSMAYSEETLVNELQEVSMQWKTALNEVEKALNDLTADLSISETALRQSKEELKMLRAELNALRLVAVRLKEASRESEMQKVELEQELKLLETRTGDLRTSFEDYKKKAEKALRRKKIWRTISITEAVVIAAAVFYIVVQ